MKKISNVLLTVFAIGILVCLFAGGISLLGYIIALVVGGETATEICKFIFSSYIPIVIKFTTGFAAIGLVGMYLKKQKALTVANEKMTK